MTSIPNEQKEQLFGALRGANLAFQKVYPGDRSERQPVHTVYGGANLFRSDLARALGERAVETFQTYAPDVQTFGNVFGLGNGRLASDVYQKVLRKLQTQAVEDFRIDFEDGYGNRANEEEDETAANAAREVAKGMEAGTLPPFIGIRIKPFTEEMKERGLRTLDIFISTLAKESGGRLPDNFVVMLPKVTIPEQPATLAAFFDILEQQNGLAVGSLRMEMMVETTQSIMDLHGTNPLYRFIQASKGRCIAMHFGTYDYTASAGITARYQEMDHPVCDFAHHMTKVALAHTGIWLSDGATNTMPIGPHRGDLTDTQKEENRAVVHRAWKKGYDHIRHSLWNGYYQGWDLNPAQLPMRYAAVFAFFLESYDDAVDRLKTFVEKAARATLIGDVFDDAATGQGLLNFFLKALNSGAITEEEVLRTGLTLDEIRGRSFKKILENRARK
ncbi:phosphoenolpyruvate kinase [Flaviaesturariibacter flavus]|uniref:Phosphoenolpyruvate kinase n=1 Tax=Flaviaesturariibacter flavus TaxID=2502780 RepID=A0A4R1BQ18_9BACT|nr:aldolase/citrate lyase family protein [Flaviaesturariibacter flavus]TCJ19618.1 phosphoenolpyruvate kinase [Flaviaesturariibacter flavus]